MQHKESPWHRMVAYMFVAGRTTVEIARATGRTLDEVRHLCDQQWFQRACDGIKEQNAV